MDNAQPNTQVEGMSETHDVLIAGGGLNGSALALALASAGCDVGLVEPLPATKRTARGFDGRAYALSISSVGVLRALGLWDTLRDTAQPIKDIRISDGSLANGPSPMKLEFASAEIEEGPMGHMVEDRHLQRSFHEAILTSERVTIYSGVRVVDHVPGPATVGCTLSDERKTAARLLVGCDGKSSPSAARAGIRYRGWNYSQTSLVCAITHEFPHEGCAHQYFLPSGPLAVLPLPGNQSSIVWTERSELAAQIQSGDDAAYLAALALRLGGFLGEIDLAGQRFTYPLALSLADTFIAERLALVGDAAHAVHPIAGQGLNAGLKDVAALAEVVSDARRRGDDIGSATVLTQYQQWRRFDVASLSVATDAFNRLFSNDNPVLRFGRDVGLGIVNALPAVRRSLIREAAGLTGDMPRLCRGLTLD